LTKFIVAPLLTVVKDDAHCAERLPVSSRRSYSDQRGIDECRSVVHTLVGIGRPGSTRDGGPGERNACLFWTGAIGEAWATAVLVAQYSSATVRPSNIVKFGE
jgi:hypothetical protein